MFLHLLKYNPNHQPAGSPKGGQFAPKGTAGATEQWSPQSAQVLAKSFNRPVSVAEVFNDLTPEEQAKINALDRAITEKLKAGMSTHLVWTRNHDGKHYLPERVKAHRAVLDKVKNGFTNEKGEWVPGMDEFKAKEGETPMLTVLGGRGGSGKSQLKGLAYNEEGSKKSFVLDPDEIKSMLSKQVNHGEWNGADAGLWHEEGDHIFKQLIEYARVSRISMVLDMTLKSDKTSLVLSFKKAGFDLKGAYMFLPPKDAATRSARRALQPGGRYVPTDVIVGTTGPDGRQNGGNYKNEANFDKMVRYFNKGYTIHHNMVKWPEPPVLVVDHRKENPHYRKSRKADEYMEVLKFNPHHDALGRFASGGVGNAEFTDLDRKIIDLKPERRPLSDPKQVKPLGSIIPDATYVPYTKVPFFEDLMQLQGTDINADSGKEQKASRDVLFSQQPVEVVAIRDLIFTQNVVHHEAVKNFKNVNAKPVQVARHRGKMYLLDGHHRVAFEAMNNTVHIDAQVLDLDQGRARKFNPNHDERGRFTVAGNGQGVSFVSPNVDEGMDVKGAEGAVRAARHQDVVAIATEVDALLDLRSKHESGVGAWSDGAENTMLGRVYGNASYDQIRLSAAMKGMLADQKAVIPFKVEKDGPDSMYKVKVSDTDLKSVHAKFSEAGLEFHTMVPHSGHTDVYVFDPGTQLKKQVQEAGARHGIEISQWRGRGEFLGSWDTRQEGRDAYQAVIDAHLGQDRRGAWDRLHSRWRQSHPVVKGLSIPSYRGMMRTEVAWQTRR